MKTKKHKKRNLLSSITISNFSDRLLMSSVEKVANYDNDGNQNDDELVLWLGLKMKSLTDLP